VYGRRLFTPDTAPLLAQVLRMPADFWGWACRRTGISGTPSVRRADRGGGDCGYFGVLLDLDLDPPRKWPV